MNYFEIVDLHAGYEKGVEIIKGISISINKGDSLGVIGLNGSGKSTLGKSIMNILPIRSGRIFINGEDVTDFKTQTLSMYGFSIMRQGGQVFSTMTVKENLDIAFGVNSDLVYRDMISKMIPLLNSENAGLLNITADKLSGGQRHQLALAMSWATHPSLLILDEPSAGLSPVAVESMYSLLKQVRQSLNMTIILIEQNINKAISFCDRCLLLSQGKIVEEYCEMSEDEMRIEIMRKLGL